MYFEDHIGLSEFSTVDNENHSKDLALIRPPTKDDQLFVISQSKNEN